MEIRYSLPAIGLILHNTKKAAADDDVSDDCKYVDDDFRRKYYKDVGTAPAQGPRGKLSLSSQFGDVS